MIVSSVWTTSWLLALSLTVNYAAAQSLSSIPQCGQNCFQVAFNEFSRSCPNRDAACLCSQPGFNPEITSCTSQQCVSTSDNSTTLAFLTSYCGSASQNASVTSVTSSITVTSSVNGTSSSVTITPYPMTNVTQSANATGISSTGPTMTSSGGAVSTVTARVTAGTVTASPSASVSQSQSLGVKSDIDAWLLLSVMVASLLLVAFPL